MHRRHSDDQFRDDGLRSYSYEIPSQGRPYRSDPSRLYDPRTPSICRSYIVLGKLNLLDSYGDLILSNCVSIFAIFLIRQAFLQVSHEMVEAGRMDGASHSRILWTILIPLTRSSFAVLALITFIEQYNNYFWPMLITKSPNLQLVIGRPERFSWKGVHYGSEVAADYGSQLVHDCSVTRFIRSDAEDNHSERQPFGRCKQGVEKKQTNKRGKQPCLK